MTDKKFDDVIKSALTSDEVPAALNSALKNRALRKRRSAKIFTFAKFGSAVAAVFICAIAILSYYNSESDNRLKAGLTDGNETPPTENQTSSSEFQKDIDNFPVTTDKPGTSSDLASGNPEVAKAMQDHPENKAAPESPQMRSGISVGKNTPLSALFNPDYDYKTIIEKKIKEQIGTFADSSAYSFDGLSDDVKFTVNKENRLTIVFPAGEILPEEHGEQYFTVGTLANGVLD